MNNDRKNHVERLRYELKLEFNADDEDAQALLTAISLIANAWSRHKRIFNYTVFMVEGELESHPKD